MVDLLGETGNTKNISLQGNARDRKRLRSRDPQKGQQEMTLQRSRKNCRAAASFNSLVGFGRRKELFARSVRLGFLTATYHACISGLQSSPRAAGGARR